MPILNAIIVVGAVGVTTVKSPAPVLWAEIVGMLLGRLEIFPVVVALRKLILQNVGAAEIKDAAIEGGMLTLRRSGLEKVKMGLTTVEEVIRVTFAD